MFVQGFLNLNKPAGFTSHDCVGRVRRLLRQRRVGHGGTLDPAATGVLPIAVGKATRLLAYLPDDKAYEATVRFGVCTATDDLDGEVLYAEPVPFLAPETVRDRLAAFVGTLTQIPPKYSAIQVDGERLYDRARRGEPVEVPARTVTVHRLDWRGWRGGSFPEADLAIACGPGTYIRAIARDLGEALGTGATLARLVRTRSGGFDLADSTDFEEIAAAQAAGSFALMPPDRALAHLPAIALADDDARRWRCGQAVAAPLPGSDGATDTGDATETEDDGDRWRVRDETGEFLGLGKRAIGPEGPQLAPAIVIAP